MRIIITRIAPIIEHEDTATIVGQPVMAIYLRILMLLDHPRTNGYAQERSWDQSRSRSRSQTGRARNVGGNRRLDGKIEPTVVICAIMLSCRNHTHYCTDVLTDIQQHWDYMAGDNCVPIHIALKLLDPSSLGLASRYDEFNYTHQNLQNALKTIVNGSITLPNYLREANHYKSEHHQGFNSSIGTFHKIQTSLNSSQHRIHSLKDSLINAKGNLSMTKPELNNLAATSQSYDEMLQILNSMFVYMPALGSEMILILLFSEQLQLVPEKLEKQISDKKFLSAVDTLQEAIGSIDRSDVKAISALSDLSIYFSNQEHVRCLHS